ncbi:hypothetical protein K1W69_17515 [Hoeflea sp. WL0058]|uniref:Uncharacterized protein n=1 Tax=Flavimaribacter sediminis TaxID=2865987 RepID=A0AAE2ZN54_9HYPH|nr:hypothetical protein [Flavimaribacter sediminis]MBW8638999.1 hypothetical protein [Flavimaribacter sediminis]
MADTETQGPLLDLNTLIERPTIRIDGKAYEILSPEELSILDSQRFERWGRKIEALAKTANENDDDADELTTLIDTVTSKIAIGVPEDVRARLTNAHKDQVISVFTGLLLGGQAAAAGAALRLLIGETSSPVSNVSSAARQAGGSKKRQPAS